MRIRATVKVRTKVRVRFFPRTQAKPSVGARVIVSVTFKDSLSVIFFVMTRAWIG